MKTSADAATDASAKASKAKSGAGTSKAASTGAAKSASKATAGAIKPDEGAATSTRAERARRPTGDDAASGKTAVRKPARRAKAAGPATGDDEAAEPAGEAVGKGSAPDTATGRATETPAALSVDPGEATREAAGAAREMLRQLALTGNAPTAQKLAENVDRIEALSRRLMAALVDRAPPNHGVEGPGPDLYLTAAGAFVKTLTEQPARMIEQQVNYWAETLKNYSRAQGALARQGLTAPEDDGPRDRRFANPLWQTHPYFNLIKRQYQTNAAALRAAAAALELPDQIARQRLDWLTQQIIDMMAPTNFLATNPDALEKAIETEGESLVRGLENLVRDVESHGGELIVSLADRTAFAVGENIGTAEGTVVHRTPLFELIQYAATTDKVHATPLLIFPPWINKFYILDLKPENSLIRWLVGQGHSLFIVSWKNPDASMSQTGIEDYVEAYLEAMDKVRELTDQKQLNVVGYCIAGTTLALTLALLKSRKDQRVKSATFFTTLTDFSDQGEFTTFLQPDFVRGIAEEVERHGLMRAQLMSRTMSFLRANDLVWGPAIRSYMLGEAPPAFDLLFWNGDSTNLPGRMALQYLEGLCTGNRFASDGFELFGQRLHITDVDVPLCAVACETDHIAPWKDCWRGVAQMGSAEKSFILSQSGHIAGIVNPPSKKKYGHYTGPEGFSGDHEGWRAGASFHEGSWWPRWGAWLEERSGGMVPARDPGTGLEPAPGRYVHERA